LTIPDSAKKIAILIYNTTGQFIGTLDSVNMSNLSTGITETSTQPFQFILEQNYPNPFNPNTTIGYELPVRSSVKFSIYDILGREVKLVNWTVQSAGHHSIRWNGMDQYDRPLPSGMYVYRLSSRSLEDERAFDKAAKMVLVK
jgi:hypothetical protein